MRSLRSFAAATVLAGVTACGTPPAPPQTLAVEVFADDTIPVLFTLEQRGSIQVGVSAAETLVQPDQSILFRTPAVLTVRKGDGSSAIRVRGAGRVAVQPAGVSPDSAERVAIVGSEVRLVRAPNAPRVDIALVTP